VADWAEEQVNDLVALRAQDRRGEERFRLGVDEYRALRLFLSGIYTTMLS
jgi:hypothetical protein